MAFLSHCPLSVKRPRSLARLICSACSSSPALESTSNPRIKFARSLLRRRHRDSSKKILLEGHRLVLDAVGAGHSLDELYYTENALSRGPSLRPAFASAGSRAISVSDKVLASISDTVTPQGVVAVITRPSKPIPDTANLILVCDGVQDPGNLGTLMRAAAGAGVDGVMLTSGCVDAWGLKAIRSGMGAQLRLPVVSNLACSEVLDMLEKRKVLIYVADGSGDASYSEVDWNQAVALVIGSEANGPSIEMLQNATKIVRVPMANDVESLNAAVAGAVMLFEASRQRDASQSL